MEEIKQNQQTNSQIPTQAYQAPNQSSGQYLNDAKKPISKLLRYALIILGSVFGVWVSLQMMRIYNFVPSNFTCLDNINLNLKIIGVVMVINIFGGAYVFLKITYLLAGRTKAAELIRNFLFVLILLFWIIGGLFAILASFIPPGVSTCPSL